MRIAISALTKTIGGPRTYSIELIKSIVKKDRVNEYYILSEDGEFFSNLDGTCNIEIKLNSPYLRPFWDHLRVPQKLKEYDIDLFHGTKNSIPVKSPCPCVVTIHDLAPFLYPKTFTLLQRKYFKFNVVRGVEFAKKIITHSKSTAEQIMRLLSLKREKIEVINPGVGERFKKINDGKMIENFSKKYDLGQRNILFLGTIQPRKNVDLLINVFKSLKREEKIPHKLVIVGRKGWLYDKFETLICNKNREDIIYVEGASDEEIPFFYNCAEVFVSPSSYEGFGLTLLEAMACGIPVITTNCETIKESIKNNAIFAENRDGESLKKAIITAISDKKLRKEKIEQGVEHVKRFSWKDYAERILEVYRVASVT